MATVKVTFAELKAAWEKRQECRSTMDVRSWQQQYNRVCLAYGLSKGDDIASASRFVKNR